jgi:opacity protein-like surface antigen
MSKFVRSLSLFAAFGCLVAVPGAHAQSDTAVEHKQFERMDLFMGVPYESTRTTSGSSPNYIVNSQIPSSAAGFLMTFRYTYSPFIGVEMNYKRARFTQNYTYTPFPYNTTDVLGVQASVIETSWGYVAHTPSTYAGFKPFGGAGVGSIEFKPTPAGGQGLIRQFRLATYWNLGADYEIAHSHFGARAEIRQLFYKAPDFGQSYLTSGAHTSTLEPSIGFYARF